MAMMRIVELARAGAGILLDTPVVFEWEDRTHSMMQDVLGLKLKVNTVRETPPGAEEPVEQVMSTEWSPFEMHGEWMDKWAGDGFAWNTFVEFARLVKRTSLVRLELGRHSLIGLLTDLDIRYRTDHEIAWQVTMSPHVNETIGNARRPPSSAPTTMPFTQRATDMADSFDLVDALMDLVDASVPVSADGLDEIDSARTQLDELRGSLEDQYAAIDALAVPPDPDLTPAEFLDVTKRKIEAVTGGFRHVEVVALETFQTINGITSDVVLAYDDVVGMLRFEEWIRSMANESIRTYQVAAAGELDARARNNSRVRAVHRTRADESLERISARYYGTPDNWTLIYDANALDSIILEGGIDLVIPEPQR